jgi:putative resolvase
VAYCRVSSQAQKPDLENQRTVLEQFCAARGLTNLEVITESSGGGRLNFTQKKFMALMQAIYAYEVKTLVIVHKDRTAEDAVQREQIRAVSMADSYPP